MTNGYTTHQNADTYWIMSNLSLALKQARLRANLSMDQVATELGISRSAVSQWENPSVKSQPTIEKVIKLSLMYQVDLAGLMLGTVVPLDSNQSKASGNEPFNRLLANNLTSNKGKTLPGRDAWYSVLVAITSIVSPNESGGLIDKDAPATPGKLGSIAVLTHDPNAFALLVRDSGLHPSIKDGWVLLVEPGAKPQVGDYIIITVQGGYKILREFIGWRGNELVSQSVNLDHGLLSFYKENIAQIHVITGIYPPSSKLDTPLADSTSPALSTEDLSESPKETTHKH